MTSAKIATCLLGLLLILPLAASFWMMAFRLHDSAAKLQKSLDDALVILKADIDSQSEPGFPGAIAGAVAVTQQIRLPGVSPRLWSPHPRRWVGILGLACTITIAALWIFSAFSPALRLSAGYGFSEADAARLPSSLPDPSRMISNGTWQNPPSGKD